MRHARLFPLTILALLLVPLSTAATYYHGSYTIPEAAGYWTGYDGCSWTKDGVYMTQGPPFGDNCVPLAAGSVGHAWSVNFNGSVVPPTIWHVCFWSNAAAMTCPTGSGVVPAYSAYFSFSASDGVGVKWNLTVA